MPKLREALQQTSGTDIFGNEFTLEETDIQPYIAEPGIAELEADVTKARYGGSSIQETQTAAGGTVQQTAAGPGKGPIDLSRRGDFEKAVFGQLKSDLIPDGNPFALNTTAKMNEISKTDLPELFGQIFRGQVTWQDRHLLDDEQKKYWQSEVKRYRAHVKQALDAEKAGAVDMYNQMMNQFDNAQKEQEAIRKRERQQRQDVAKAVETRGKTQEAHLRRRSELLGKIRELTTAILDPVKAKGMKETEIKAYTQELQGYRDELKVINAKLGIVAEPKKKGEGEATPVKDEKTKEGKKRTKPVVVRGKIPQDTGKRTVVSTGTYKGRKVVKYSDGSIAYADEQSE